MKFLSEPKSVTITGCLSLFYENDQPCLLQLPSDGGDQFWVTVFSTLENLHNFADSIHLKDFKIKKIDDEEDFSSSLRAVGVRIMLNPYLTPENNTRWTEILNPNDLPL